MQRTGLALLVALGMVWLAGGSARADTCGDLRSRLAALEAADRAQWSAPGVHNDPYAIERDKRGVLKALAANRCASGEVRRDTRANRLFSSLFGKRPLRTERFRDRSLGPGEGGVGLSGGPYRTLCVRTCDGYYFPISHAAGSGELKRDETACHALCPGQEVALYVQSSGRDGGPSVSLAGQSYAALPTAFRYRSEYDRACTCGPIDASVAAAFQAFSVAPPTAPSLSDMDTAGGPGIALPRLRPESDDPETLANRAGGVVAGVSAPVPRGQAVYAEGPDGRVVRLVGDDAPYLTE